MTRAERAVEAIRLREQGLTAREIADQLGVSRSYASSLYTDPDGAKVRARKESYGGSCVVCGAQTTGSDGRANAPRYCSTHANQNPEWLAAITKWSAELLIARIQEWAAIFGDPPATRDWRPSAARAVNDEARARRYEDANGYWPTATLVINRFGSWNAGIAAAGFDTRACHGGGGNQHLRRSQRKAAA